MKRTVDEKLAFNKQRNDDFAIGYCAGVQLYREYPRASAKDKARTKKIIDTARELAHDFALQKGVMCGVRDAANERKARKGK